MSEENFEIANIDQEAGESTDEEYYNMSVLEDVDHPLVPDANHEYLMREINGVTDLELVSFAMENPDFFTLLEGEAGVGKNHSIEHLAAETNWPRARVNFGVGTTYEKLVGRYVPAGEEDLVESAISRDEAIDRVAERVGDEDKAKELLPEGSSFTWKDGILTRAVKYGWIFVADEINAADDDAIMPLNGLTEDRDSRYLTIEETSEVITPHPLFRFVATRNPEGYAGVGEMNDAFESRGWIIEYDYHDPRAEKEILKTRTPIVQNAGSGAMDGLVTLANDIRMQEQNGNEIMTKISTRDLIKAGTLTEIMDIRNAVKTVFLGIADPTDEQSIKELIETQKF